MMGEAGISVAVAALMLLCIGGAGAQPTDAPATERTEQLAEWESLEYGMFIQFSMNTFNAIEIDPSTLPPPPLTFDKKATASNVYQGMARHGPGQAIDDDPSTRWATDSGITSATLEVDLGRPLIFSRAVIMEAYPELKRVRAFQIEYRQGDSWKTCFTGTRIGPELAVTFEPVTARRVRLNITESTDGPTLWEFQLYGP